MKLIQTYQAYLTSRATGLSRLGWYVASAKEGAPWVLGIAAAAILGSFVPEPHRLLAFLVVFVPSVIGWIGSQIYMMTVHRRDLRARWGIRD